MSTLPTGKLLVTRGVNDTIATCADFAKFVLVALARHRRGDFGDMCDEDREANQNALTNGERVLSVYLLPEPLQKSINTEKIWIITEWDRRTTMVLFPAEY